MAPIFLGACVPDNDVCMLEDTSTVVEDLQFADLDLDLEEPA